MAGKRNRRELDLTSREDVEAYLGRELLRSVDRPNLLQYRPHRKQEMFHSSSKKIRLYIGGNRSGKTVGGVVEDLYWLKKEHPYKRLPIAPSEPCRGRAIAVDFVNGIDKIIAPQFAQWTPKSMLIDGSWTQSYDKAHKTLNFENGSFVEFMSYDQDLDKFAGTSRHFIHFDEEPPQTIWGENRMRLIDTGGHTWLTMTPVEGMTWVYDTIYEPGILGHKNIDVIIVDMEENPYLNQKEVDDYLDGLDENEIAARKKGQFVQMGGLIYKQFDPKAGGLHVIRGMWRPPHDEHWNIGLGLDHGLNNPTAIGFHAYNTDGDVITFDEHYESGLVISEHAKKIHAKLYDMGLTFDQLEMAIADPSIKNRDPVTGTSIQQEYAKYGIYWALGNNDVPAGIERVTSYLRPRGIDKRPRYRVTENCIWHRKELSRYRWETYDTKQKNFENNAYEIPHKHNDHCPDELRYFLMSRPDVVHMRDEEKKKRMMRINASVATRGDLYAGHELKEEQARLDTAMEEGLSFTTDGTWVYDEHMGGVW